MRSDIGHILRSAARCGCLGGQEVSYASGERIAVELYIHSKQPFHFSCLLEADVFFFIIYAPIHSSPSALAEVKDTARNNLVCKPPFTPAFFAL